MVKINVFYKNSVLLLLVAPLTGKIKVDNCALVMPHRFFDHVLLVSVKTNKPTSRNQKTKDLSIINIALLDL